jgi:hypothetical protein
MRRTDFIIRSFYALHANNRTICYLLSLKPSFKGQAVNDGKTIAVWSEKKNYIYKYIEWAELNVRVNSKAVSLSSGAHCSTGNTSRDWYSRGN